MKFSLLSLLLLPVADAFTTPMNSKVSFAVDRSSCSSRMFSTFQDQEKDQKSVIEVSVKDSKYLNSVSAASAALCLLSSEVANAAGPDWGKIFRDLRLVS
jgi:hypothetical protein